jgi:hypothetical protein
MRFPSGCPSSAGYKFVARLISAAFEGKTGVVEPSYVYVKDDAALQKEIGESIDFFSVPVELGVRPLSFFTSLERSEIAELSWPRLLLQPSGAEKLLPVGKLSEYEASLLKAALAELTGSISSTSFSVLCSNAYWPCRLLSLFLSRAAQSEGVGFISSPKL